MENKTTPPDKMTEPPFPDKMSFREMLTGLFETSFLTEEELTTISDAGEMYANGCITQLREAPGQWEIFVDLLEDFEVWNENKTIVFAKFLESLATKYTIQRK